jgi:hypothetical protein
LSFVIKARLHASMPSLMLNGMQSGLLAANGSLPGSPGN